MNCISMETFEFACEAHKGQLYGVVPYHSHLSDVYYEVTHRYSKHEELVKLQLVALLHDILEDTSTTSLDLYYERFSEDVINAVISVTKVNGESYKDYITRVKANHLGLIVKKCDTICNLKQSLEDCDDWRVNKYCKQLVLLGEE